MTDKILADSGADLEYDDIAQFIGSDKKLPTIPFTLSSTPIIRSET